MKPSNVLILPGWENSGPQHWQTLWEKRHGYVRVEQHDWMRPLRGDWVARLEEMVLSRDEPAVLVAHSLGCILAATWSALSKNTHRVKSAFGMSARLAGVSMVAGRTAFTRTPRSSSSSASDSVSRATPDFDAA